MIDQTKTAEVKMAAPWRVLTAVGFSAPVGLRTLRAWQSKELAFGKSVFPSARSSLRGLAPFGNALRRVW